MEMTPMDDSHLTTMECPTCKGTRKAPRYEGGINCPRPIECPNPRCINGRVPREPGPKREQGWLIESERDGQPIWWNTVTWIADSTRATRFARKEDAEELINSFEIDKAKATEHIWED